MEKSLSTLLLWWPQHLPSLRAHLTWSSPTPACWTRSLHSLLQSPAPKLTGGAAAVATSPQIPWTLQLCWHCNLSLSPPLYPVTLGGKPLVEIKDQHNGLQAQGAQEQHGETVHLPGTSWDRRNQTKWKPYRDWGGRLGKKSHYWDPSAWTIWWVGRNSPTV